MAYHLTLRCLLALSVLCSLGSAHTKILKATCDGGKTFSIGMGINLNIPIDGQDPTPYQLDSPIIRTKEKDNLLVNGCGRTKMLTNIDAALEAALANAKDQIANCKPGDTVVLTLLIVNTDGSGSFLVDIDKLLNVGVFVELGQLIGVDGKNGVKPTANTTVTGQVSLPPDQTCEGGEDRNLCALRIRNLSDAGPFGGCVAIRILREGGNGGQGNGGAGNGGAGNGGNGGQGNGGQGNGGQGNKDQGNGGQGSKGQGNAKNPNTKQGGKGGDGSKNTGAGGRKPGNGNQNTGAGGNQNTGAGGNQNSNEEDGRTPDDITTADTLETILKEQQISLKNFNDFLKNRGKGGNQGNGQNNIGNGQTGGNQTGDTQTGGTQTGGTQTGGNQIGDNQKGGNQKGGNQKGGNQKGGNQKGGNQKGGNQKGGNQKGGNQKGDNQKGGNQKGGNQKGGNQKGGNQKGGNQIGGSQNQGK